MNIPKEVREAHSDICSKCEIRKWYARRDWHIDWLECPYDCKNDYEHYLRELEEKEND